jgi:hypothetical protein
MLRYNITIYLTALSLRFISVKSHTTRVKQQTGASRIVSDLYATGAKFKTWQIPGLF